MEALFLKCLRKCLDESMKKSKVHSLFQIANGGMRFSCSGQRFQSSSLSSKGTQSEEIFYHSLVCETRAFIEHLIRREIPTLQVA